MSGISMVHDFIDNNEIGLWNFMFGTIEVDR